MVLNAVKHMQTCKAVGTVIVPEWPSASFWPSISPKFGIFKTFLMDLIFLPNRVDLCIPGRGQCLAYKRGQRMFEGCLSFKLIAMRFDFRNA
jgi:hypothetical protein